MLFSLLFLTAYFIVCVISKLKPYCVMTPLIFIICFYKKIMYIIMHGCMCEVAARFKPLSFSLVCVYIHTCMTIVHSGSLISRDRSDDLYQVLRFPASACIALDQNLRFPTRFVYQNMTFPHISNTYLAEDRVEFYANK